MGINILIKILPPDNSPGITHIISIERDGYVHYRKFNMETIELDIKNLKPEVMAAIKDLEKLIAKRRSKANRSPKTLSELVPKMEEIDKFIKAITTSLERNHPDIHKRFEGVYIDEETKKVYILVYKEIYEDDSGLPDGFEEMFKGLVKMDGGEKDPWLTAALEVVTIRNILKKDSSN